MFETLVAGVDEALGEDPETLDDATLGAALVALHRIEAQLAAVKARLAAAADTRRVGHADGHRTTAAWLAHHTRMPLGTARADVRLARRLRSMPATEAALAEGEITVAHAHRLASLNAPGLHEAFTAVEPGLVDHATTMRWADFARVCDYWRQCAVPDAAETDAANDTALRRAHLSPGLGGTGHLDALLTPLGHAAVATALDRIERELFAADWSDAKAEHGDATTAAHLARMPAQRRHDALVEMATRAMTAPKDGTRPRPLISVLVGYETFAGRICELADGTVISPGTATSLLDHAVIERVVFDGPSRVIDVGQARLFTGALRRAIEIRDRRCAHPGCHEPAHRCQVDHIVRWADGGPTTQSNGRLLCAFHNRWRETHPGRGDPLAA